MPARIALFILTVAGLAGASHAQYEVNLEATWRSLLDADGVSYAFFPFIEVFENGTPTEAEVTLSSNGSSFDGSFNGSFDGSSAGSVPFTDLASMRDRIDDNWLLTINEPVAGGTGSVLYDYLVDFDFNPALPGPPAFSSSDVTTLGEYDGTIDWSLQGTSAAFPGSGASLRAQLFAADFSRLTFEDLPLAATSWSPGLGIADGLDEVRLTLGTRGEAVDPAALSLASIIPLTTGGEGAVAPTVTFGTTDLTYEAFLGEDLTVIPEPTTAALFALAGVGLLARRRRRDPSHTRLTAKENTTMPDCSPRQPVHKFFAAVTVAVAGLLVATPPSHASVVTLDFDQFISGSQARIPNTFQEGGFTVSFSNFGFALGSFSSGYLGSPSVFPGSTNSNVTFTNDDALPFMVVSMEVDVLEFTDFGAGDNEVSFSGVLTDGSPVSDAVALDFLFGTETISPSSSFENLDSFTMTQGNGSNSPIWHLDSITFDVIPEPGSAALLALSTLGLMTRRRRGGAGGRAAEGQRHQDNRASTSPPQTTPLVRRHARFAPVLVTAVSALLLTVLTATNAHAAFVSFSDDGTFQAASVTEGGVTVTGSSTVNVLNFNGLGVVGGVLNDRVDDGEFLDFVADGKNEFS